MGAGDQFQKPKFSVPMGLGGTANWPYDNEPVVAPESYVTCPRCGALAAPERTHRDATDKRPTAGLVCFGLRRVPCPSGSTSG
jgi:hypothetical protein